jgi:hypothetical protein
VFNVLSSIGLSQTLVFCPAQSQSRLVDKTANEPKPVQQVSRHRRSTRNNGNNNEHLRDLDGIQRCFLGLDRGQRRPGVALRDGLRSVAVGHDRFHPRRTQWCATPPRHTHRPNGQPQARRLGSSFFSDEDGCHGSCSADRLIPLLLRIGP